MKAQLKEIKTWQPHEDKTKEEHEIIERGMLQVFVGSLYVGWVTPVTTEPEELFELSASPLLRYMDWNSTLTDATRPKKKGQRLQVILDNIELVFKDFLNKVVK